MVSLLDYLASPVLFKGDATTAYRDPAALYHAGTFYLFFTFVTTDVKGAVYMVTAMSQSTDLVSWTPPRALTPRDPAHNFSSPGNVVRVGDEWVLCLQTYPRPNGEKYGNGSSRLWIMRSFDLETWSDPELLRVKGPNVPDDQMGRMIDPFLLQERDASGREAGKWWCFYKQNGVSASWSLDLQTWHYAGRAESGENVCVLPDPSRGGYVMFHSPENGIGIMHSNDLTQWETIGFTTLGQTQWDWAQGRITAGFVLDLRHEPTVGKYLMFFHASGPENETTMFDTHASLGIAWSEDFLHWEWPGGSKST